MLNILLCNFNFMKKVVIFLICYFVAFYNFSYAGVELSTKNPIYGSGVYTFWNDWISVEKIVFPETGSWVWLNAKNLDEMSQTKVNGTFWIQSLWGAIDKSLWWVTFDHGISASDTNLVQSGSTNIYILKGFAWSKAAGWIYFWDNLWEANKAKYNRTTGKFSWYGWNQNIGWIPMWGLTLITTAPEINLPNIFAATDMKSIQIHTPALSVISEIENHANTTKTIRTDKNFSHNFQTAKTWNYSYEIKDNFWNKRTWDVQVVANIPVNISPIISSWSKLADWKKEHSIELELKDTYGNPVVNIPWIKKVEVDISFHNDINKNQIDEVYFFMWDSVSYNNKSWFPYISNIVNATTATHTINGKYQVSFSSLTPTKTWYPWGKWDINIKTLSYTVKAQNWHTGIWELGVDKVDIFWWTKPESSYFSFSPAVLVESISANPERILRDVPVTFNGNVQKATLENIQDFKIQHILDISTNLLMSFQDVKKQESSSDIVTCLWYNTWSYIIQWWNVNCSLTLSNSSNIFLSKSWGFSSYTSSFSATPKLVTIADPIFSPNYSSIISYTIDGNTVMYNSMQRNFQNLISNQQVKIAGISNNGWYETSINSTNKILDTTILKSDLRTQIAKNVETLTKNTKIAPNIEYSTWTYTLWYWWSGKDTLIVKWADVIIKTNILKSWWGKLNSIVVLRENGVGWNIWIDKNIQFISAIIYADWHLLSGNGTDVYTEIKMPSDAQNQLFIKWTVVSNNTIWGSSKIPYLCPYRYNIWLDCNEQHARKYDLNHFRHFIEWENGRWKIFSGVWNDRIETWFDIIDMAKTWYKEAPMIIEYDNQIQLNPPKIFLSN